MNCFNCCCETGDSWDGVKCIPGAEKCFCTLDPQDVNFYSDANCLDVVEEKACVFTNDFDPPDYYWVKIAKR